MPFELTSLRAQAPAADELTRLVKPTAEASVTFDLPWPWGRETFELGNIRSLNYITVLLGGGKTRLARTIAHAAYLGLERLTDEDATAGARMDTDLALKSRVDQALAWLLGDGAVVSAALVTLLVALKSEDVAILVIDMVEQGLDQPSQEALIAHLRRHRPGARPLFLLTRSSAILDLTAVRTDEVIILCHANHSPPIRIFPYPGTSGYEAVATRLASPEVRARTEGMVAMLPQVA